MLIKRFVFFLVTLVLLAGLAVTADALDFIDTQNHWAEIPIDRWTDNGILNGYSGMQFRPDSYIKRGELFKMVAAVMNYRDSAGNPFSDLSTDDWYYDYIMKLVAAGVVNGSDGRVDAEAFITREQAIAILARIFNISHFEDGIKSFVDWNDVSYWARAEVGGMCRAGYVRGTSGYINPRGNLRRAEAVQLFDNIIRGFIFEAESYSTDINGLTVVNTSGVTLRDMVVNGDLYITQGIGPGSVLLDSVVINGDAYISGGGTDGVRMRGNSRANKLYVGVSDQNGPCRVSISSPAEAESVRVMAGSANAVIEGIIRLAEVMGDAEATLDNATADEVIMAGEFGYLRINSNSRVKTLYCPAARASVYVAGTVDYTLIEEGGVGVHIDTGRTAVMTQIDTWADDVLISGIGNVAFVFVNDGDNVRVTVPGAIVSVSPDAGPVRTGDGPEDVINPGETGQVGTPGLENALNVKKVEVTSATTIDVTFSKEPDPAKGRTPRNYTLSGDAVGVTQDQRAHPDYVEINGTKVTLTFTNARFSALTEGQTAIITVAGFTAVDGSPIGVATGIYRVPSANALLVSGTLAGFPITGIWTGGTIGEGGTQLAVTIPKRLAASADLTLNKGNSGSSIKLYRASGTEAAPTTETQYTLTQMKGLQVNDGDRIYIQVTAPNGITKLYYKLAITVISQPTLTSITHTPSSVRLNLIDLDDETHIRIAPWNDLTDTVSSWRPITKSSSAGSGYVEFDLRETADQQIIIDIAERANLFVGKADGGTIVDRKNLGEIGLASTANVGEMYYTTANTTLQVHGLNANTAYIARVTRSAGLSVIVQETNSQGVLTLESSEYVTEVEIQRLYARGIERKIFLGAPISVTSLNLDLTIGEIRADGLASGQIMRVGNLELRDTRLYNNKLTVQGLRELATMQSGTYNLYVDKYESYPDYLIRQSIIPTKLGEIAVNANLNEVEAKFIEKDKVLFSKAAGKLQSNSRLVIAEEILDNSSNYYPVVQNIDYQQLITGITNGKAELRTSSIEVAYDNADTSYPPTNFTHNRSAYLVTAASISRPVTVNKWLYTQYPFGIGTYTVLTSTTYANSNSIQRTITTLQVAPSVNVSVIQVDGEYYAAPNRPDTTANQTLRNLISYLGNNDTITFSAAGIISGINCRNSPYPLIVLYSVDINETSIAVSGGNVGARLTLDMTGIYTGRVEISGGAVDISDDGFTNALVTTTGTGANVVINQNTTVNVAASNVVLMPEDAFGAVAATETITISGTGSAILHGITVSGDRTTFKSDGGFNIAVGGSMSPRIVVGGNVASITLDSYSRSAQIVLGNDATIDMTSLSVGAVPTVNFTGTYLATLLLNAGGEAKIYDSINTELTFTAGALISPGSRLVIAPTGGTGYVYTLTSQSAFTVPGYNDTANSLQIRASSGTVTVAVSGQ